MSLSPSSGDDAGRVTILTRNEDADEETMKFLLKVTGSQHPRASAPTSRKSLRLDPCGCHTSGRVDSGSQPVHVHMAHLHPRTWCQTTARNEREISGLLAPESGPDELSASLGSSFLELVPSTHF